MPSFAEDGYDLWLRYRPVDAAAQASLGTGDRSLVAGKKSPTLDAAGAELQRGLSGLLGRPVSFASRVEHPGDVVFGTPQSSPLIAQLRLGLEAAGEEGYVIRSREISGRP